MKAIAFNFTKILAEMPEVVRSSTKIGTNVTFSNIEKEETALTPADSDALRISFDFSVSYSEEKDSKGEKGISLSGFLIIIATKKEAEELLKMWEKKELPPQLKVQLLNILLKKCSVRALQLEEEMGLPLHLPLPQVKVEKKEEKKE